MRLHAHAAPICAVLLLVPLLFTVARAEASDCMESLTSQQARRIAAMVRGRFMIRTLPDGRETLELSSGEARQGSSIVICHSSSALSAIRRHEKRQVLARTPGHVLERGWARLLADGRPAVDVADEEASDWQEGRAVEDVASPVSFVGTVLTTRVEGAACDWRSLFHRVERWRTQDISPERPARVDLRTLVDARDLLRALKSDPYVRRLLGPRKRAHSLEQDLPARLDALFGAWSDRRSSRFLETFAIYDYDRRRNRVAIRIPFIPGNRTDGAETGTIGLWVRPLPAFRRELIAASKGQGLFAKDASSGDAASRLREDCRVRSPGHLLRGTPQRILFDGKPVYVRSKQAANDESGIEDEEATPLSLVGPVLSISVAQSGCPPMGECWDLYVWRTIDARTGRKANLLEWVDERALVRALRSSPYLRRVVGTKRLARIKTLRALDRVPNWEDGYEWDIPDTPLEKSFAFFDYDPKQDRVDVRFGVMEHMLGSHFDLNAFDVCVRPKPALRQALLAAKRGEGLLGAKSEAIDPPGTMFDHDDKTDCATCGCSDVATRRRSAAHGSDHRQPQGMRQFDLGGRGKGTTQFIPGRTQVLGGLTADEIGRIVRRHWGEIKKCYSDELAQDPHLAGKVSLAWVIGPAGEVTTAGVSETDLHNQNAEDCMAAAARRWTFPPPRGGGTVNVVYPIVLQRE